MSNGSKRPLTRSKVEIACIVEALDLRRMTPLSSQMGENPESAITRCDGVTLVTAMGLDTSKVVTPYLLAPTSRYRHHEPPLTAARSREP